MTLRELGHQVSAAWQSFWDTFWTLVLDTDLVVYLRLFIVVMVFFGTLGVVGLFGGWFLREGAGGATLALRMKGWAGSTSKFYRFLYWTSYIFAMVAGGMLGGLFIGAAFIYVRDGFAFLVRTFDVW